MFLLWVGVFIPVPKNSAMTAYMLLYLILLKLVLYNVCLEAKRYFTVTLVGFSFLNSFSVLRIVMNKWLRNNTDKQWGNLRFLKEVNDTFWLLWRSLHGQIAFFGVLFTISHYDWPGSHCFLTLLNFLYYLERKGSIPSIFFLKKKKKKIGKVGSCCNGAMLMVCQGIAFCHF